jgi:hypothetical protein
VSSHRTASTISLEAVLPEVATLIPAEDHHRARQMLMVPCRQASGELVDLFAAMPSAFDFIIVDGIVLKHTRYEGRTSVELLTPGDILAPPLSASRQLESRATSTYRAHGQASLAVIEQRFRAAARV